MFTFLTPEEWRDWIVYRKANLGLLREALVNRGLSRRSGYQKRTARIERSRSIFVTETWKGGKRINIFNEGCEHPSQCRIFFSGHFWASIVLGLDKKTGQVYFATLKFVEKNGPVAFTVQRPDAS